MEIRFVIDPDRLTLEDMLLIEDIRENKRQWHSWYDLLSRFMVDEDGKLLDQDDARGVLKKLSLSALAEAQDSFAEALRARAIPPKKGGG